MEPASVQQWTQLNKPTLQRLQGIETAFSVQLVVRPPPFVEDLTAAYCFKGGERKRPKHMNLLHSPKHNRVPFYLVVGFPLNLLFGGAFSAFPFVERADKAGNLHQSLYVNCTFRPLLHCEAPFRRSEGVVYIDQMMPRFPLLQHLLNVTAPWDKNCYSGEQSHQTKGLGFVWGDSKDTCVLNVYASRLWSIVMPQGWPIMRVASVSPPPELYDHVILCIIFVFHYARRIRRIANNSCINFKFLCTIYNFS